MAGVFRMYLLGFLRVAQPGLELRDFVDGLGPPASSSSRWRSNLFHSSSAARASWPSRPSCSYIAEMAVSDSLSAASACSAES